MKTALVLIALYFSLTAQPPAAERKITFNGRKLTAEQLSRLETVEQFYKVRIQDRDYFYDDRSGAVGLWKGPVIAALPAGLGLGGPMPENASGGDTGVFVNGREIHRLDLLALMQLGPVYKGRYWVDARGFFGIEGGPALGNLFQLAQRSSGGGGQHRVYSAGEIGGIIENEAGACTSSGRVYR